MRSAAQAPHKPSMNESNSLTASARVLVVDDEPLLRLLIARCLEDDAIAIDEAATVTEALSLLRGDPPDLMLVDVNLPGVAGHELCRLVRRQPLLAGIPIIVMTGRSGANEHLDALEAGATDFIAKPFRPHELLVRVRNLLSLQAMQRELRRCQLAAEMQRVKELRQGFERYLAPAIVTRLLDDPAGRRRNLLEDSVVCDAVVMFADLRGYTSLSETLPPRRVVTVLNEFFALLVDTAHRHEGTTISMAGDCLMIAFGVPFAQDDAAARAVTTALACRQAFAREAARWRQEHGVEIGLGIGINGGEVIAGNVGAPAYMNYTLIGDVVNVAARLTARARDGEILMTRTIGRRIDFEVPALQTLNGVQLKGRSAAIDVLCATAPQRPHASGATARGGLTKFVG